MPILDFGAENDEVGSGEERMPWLSALHPFGDTSPLTRFVIGLDEALRDYRGSEERIAAAEARFDPTIPGTRTSFIGISLSSHRFSARKRTTRGKAAAPTPCGPTRVRVPAT